MYSNENTHAVYYCQYTIGHEPKVVNGVISLGAWGDESNPSQRYAFPFRIWTNERNYQVGLMDVSECQWSDAEILDVMLDRKDSLNHPWIKEVFHITDYIVAEDQPVIEYLHNSC